MVYAASFHAYLDALSNTVGKAYLNASEVAFLGAFPKLRKATISSVMSVSHWTDFHET
jgi:hypothetical protein